MAKRSKMTSAFRIAVLISCGTLTLFGQAQENNDDRGFDLPSKYTSVLLVRDPKCPIELSGPTRVIGWKNGAVSLGFNLQNVSKTNVESFVIEETDWFGSHGYNIPASMMENMLFVPFMSMPADDWLGERKEDLVAFDEKKVGENVLRPSNKIWIVMIVKVKLSDGTVYDASKKYQELKEFFDKQFEENNSGEVTMDEREQKLRNFVDNLMKSKKN